jgi:hypothetical protein
MPFSDRWHTLLEECEDLSADTSLVTPLSHERFRITDTQEHRVIIEFVDTGEARPLQREHFERLYQNIQDTPDAFALDRLPTDAEPLAAVLSLHPRFEIDERDGVITETDSPTGTQLVDTDDHDAAAPERTEPDVSIYADALLLVDALERHDLTALAELDTGALANLYTLLSDVQRNANDLRKEVADILLDRLHHDRPVAGQYGSIQRTSRRTKSLKDETEVLATLEAVGIDPDQVMSVDSKKVDDALEVTELSERDVYEIEERAYVRKAEVDEERKESRLQGLKDQLAASDDPEAETLRREVEELEGRIEDLTEFRTGQEFRTET